MMGEQDQQKISAMARWYIDVFLVVLGQALTIILISSDEMPMYLMLFAMALNAAGLGIRAKRGGRSVIAWALTGCVFPLIVPLAGIIFMVLRDLKGAREKRPFPLYGHIVIAAVLFLIGGPLMDSFSFAFLSTIAAVIWVLAGRRGLYAKKQKFVLVMVYIMAFAMAVGVKTANNHVSQKNAAVIIAACDEYLKKNGRYPGTLQDLVPGYLPKVPAARYTWTSGRFWYHRDRLESGNRYSLMYTVEAPFARRVYSSERKTWRSID